MLRVRRSDVGLQIPLDALALQGRILGDASLDDDHDAKAIDIAQRRRYAGWGSANQVDDARFVVPQHQALRELNLLNLLLRCTMRRSLPRHVERHRAGMDLDHPDVDMPGV